MPVGSAHLSGKTHEGTGPITIELHDTTGHIGTASRSGEALTVTVYDTLEAAKTVWLDLEARGHYTPYQRYDWVRLYIECGFRPELPLAIVVMSHAGRPIAIAPFEIVRKGGVRTAQIIGMPISNGDALVIDPEHSHRLTPAALRTAFSALKADIVSFHSVALQQGPVDNPLAKLPRALSPDHFYFNALEPGEHAFIDKALPHKRRTNIRRSQRRLDEHFGAVELRRLTEAKDVEMALGVFIEQREQRFAAMGVKNIFASPSFQKLFREAILLSAKCNRPLLCVHALYAGDQIVATSLGACGKDHYSQYINSTASGEPSRYSLMGVTMSLLVDALRNRGISSIDMGLGDFDYKLDWTRRQEVYDIVVPVSIVGRAAAPLVRARRSLKRTIKQTPAFWRVARTIQSRLNDARRRLGKPGA